MTDPTTDRVAFATDVLGLELWAHQAEALRSDAPVNPIPGGRRSGKSVVGQVGALHVAATIRGSEFIVTGPNFDRPREFVREAAELWRGSPFARDAVLDEGATRLTFPGSGGAIVAVPPTAGQIRGRGRRVYGACVEEAGHCPASVWRDLRFVMADHRAEGAQVWFPGSPWRSSLDHFFYASWSLARNGDPDYWTPESPWRTDMNPRVPRDWIERERARLNSIEAAAELDGEWQTSELQLFTHGLLERATADVELPDAPDLAGVPARPVLALDPGVKIDHSAIALVYRLPGLAALNPDRDLPTFLAVPHVFPQAAPLAEVVDAVVRHHARFFSLETSGVGAMPAQEVERRVRERARRIREPVTLNRVATTNAIKAAGYATVLGLLERGQLLLKRDPDLRRQLAGLRYEQVERGGVRIEADDPAVHDDVADALMLAMLPYRPSGGGRVLCGLGTLADPDRATPDVPVAVLDQRVIETGAGLRIAARPPLQSVGSAELALTPGVDRGPALDPEAPRAEMVRAPADGPPRPRPRKRRDPDRLYRIP